MKQQGVMNRSVLFEKARFYGVDKELADTISAIEAVG